MFNIVERTFVNLRSCELISLFQGAVDRIDVRGSHDEFFVHEENIKLLAKHLQKLLESNGGRTRGDQLAASEEVCAPLWNVAGG